MLAELHREDGYTIYFLKPSTDKVNYFHTYGTIGTDPDTGIEFVQEGMMGFGGNYRFYFIDLSAGPWIYPYWYFHQNIYDIETKDEYHEFIAKYVNNALLLLFTPSYLYNPVYQSNHEIDIFLIDMTAGRVFQDISNEFINKSVIESAFAKLIPYVDWTSEIEGHMFDSLPRELQRSILRSLTFTDVEGSEGIIIVKSSDLITELNKWIVSNLPIEQLEMMEEESEKTIFIPVVLFVFDKSAYVDDAPTLGKAVPDPDDNTIPCCAIVAQDKHTLFNTGAGLSGVTIHEMGHVLGLRHPHDGHSPTEGEFIDWFFDWSYTPMTYSSPSSLGCGPSLRCGLVINEFGQFNYDALDRGMVLNLLNQTQKNIEDSKLQFVRSGDEDNLPQSVSIKLTSIQIDIEKSKEYFENMTYFNHNTFMGTKSIMDPMDDAFDFALRALLTSEELLNTSNTLSKKLEPTGIKTVSILEPHLINATGSKSGTVEVGNSIDVRSQILINIDETISFSYIVQVKDYAGATISLTWLEELAASESIEASLLWTSDTRGEFEIEIFVWNNIVDPIPLAPIKSMHVNVT